MEHFPYVQLQVSTPWVGAAGGRPVVRFPQGLAHTGNRVGRVLNGPKHTIGRDRHVLLVIAGSMHLEDRTSCRRHTTSVCLVALLRNRTLCPT